MHGESNIGAAMIKFSSHWSDIHANKNKDVSWWQENLWLEFLDKVNKFGAAIDVGAGQSPLAIELAKNGFAPVFINDLAENALDNLVKSAKAQQIELIKLVGSVLEISLPEKVNLWHDRAVFHFLTETQDIERYKSQVLSSVSSDGYLVISTFSELGPNQCSGLDVKRYAVQELAAVFSPEFRLISCEKRIHLTPWKSEQEFSIAVLQRVSGLTS